MVQQDEFPLLQCIVGICVVLSSFFITTRFQQARPKIRFCNPELLGMDLSNLVFVVTGATSGIGLAVSVQLAKQGAHVILACRDLRKAKLVADEITAATNAHAHAQTDMHAQYAHGAWLCPACAVQPANIT